MQLQDSVRLHVGCGYERKPGWVDIDLVPASADIFWDLRRGIPFADNSVDAIFHEHFLEHLPMPEGLRFTDECFRALKPGGVLRVVVPNVELILHAYASNEAALAEQFPTPLIGVQSVFYLHGHVAMYDAVTLIALLESSGFSDVTQRRFGESCLEEAPDTEFRRPGSLYVEARK